MFGLNGIGGNLIAVALLLTIVGVLATLAVQVQNSTAANPYTVTGTKVANPTSKEDVYANLSEVKMFDTGAVARVKVIGE